MESIKINLCECGINRWNSVFDNMTEPESESDGDVSEWETDNMTGYDNPEETYKYFPFDMILG